MNYWLFKSEPDCFSIDHLSKRPKQTSAWDGVRNFQARNFMREMKKGDLGFFYHSSCTPPGVVGIVEVVKEAYPDHTAFDVSEDHYDPASRPEKPRWYMVDVRLVERFPRLITLEELKNHPALAEMIINRRGNRLSITPVTKIEWNTIVKMAR